MEQYAMAISKGSKRVYVIRCSFCCHVRISDGYGCRLGQYPCEACPDFEPVMNISERVEEIFNKLPDGAGKVFAAAEKCG